MTRTYTTFTMSEWRVLGSDWEDKRHGAWTEPRIIDKDEAMSVITAHKLFPHDWMIELEEEGKIVNCGNVVLAPWE